MQTINFPKEVKTILHLSVFDNFFLIFDEENEFLYQKNEHELSKISFEHRSTKKIISIDFFDKDKYCIASIDLGVQKKNIHTGEILKFKTNKIASTILAIPEKNILIVGYGDEEYYNKNGVSGEILDLENGERISTFKDKEISDIYAMCKDKNNIYCYGFDDKDIIKTFKLENGILIEKSAQKIKKNIYGKKIHKIPQEPIILIHYSNAKESLLYAQNEEKNTIEVLRYFNEPTNIAFFKKQYFIVDNEKREIKISTISECLGP